MSIKKTILAGLLALSTYTVMAQTPMTNCPTPTVLKERMIAKSTDLGLHFVKFDTLNGKLFMSSEHGGKFDFRDPVFYGYGVLAFVVSAPVDALDDYPLTMLDKMQLDSNESATITLTKTRVAHICSYSMNGNEDVKGVLVQIYDSGDNMS